MVSASTFLETRQAAEYLGLRAQTLRQWRQRREGPAYIKLGNGRNSRCVYRVGDLEAFVAASTVKPGEAAA